MPEREEELKGLLPTTEALKDHLNTKPAEWPTSTEPSTAGGSHAKKRLTQAIFFKNRV